MTEKPIERQDCGRGSKGPEESLGYLLSKVGKAVETGFATRLSHLGLDPRQHGLLQMLCHYEGPSQQTIVSMLSIPPSTTVGLIDELEARGLVDRRLNPKDRRVRSLFVTEAGRELARQAYLVRQDWEEEFCSGLTTAERSNLRNALELLATNVVPSHRVDQDSEASDGHGSISAESAV
ncbi:MAG: MarR family winged helix-turn-helix transcriptional regulator [Acidimicrobiales bacterium]